MTEPKRIALFDAKLYDKESFTAVNKEYGYQLIFHEHRLTKKSVSLANGMDAVCVFVNDQITKPVIDALYEKGVRLIALRCAGYNNVDLKAAYSRIHVVRVPAYSPYAVAEHIVAMILTLNRKTHKAYTRTRENNFSINGLVGFDMYKKTAGVIGAGKIGKTLLRILKGFGMELLIYDTYRDHAFAKELDAHYVSLDEIYAKSDIISLNCPLTKSAYHLINRDAIQKMKRGVMIINASRGALIDTPALIEGLKTKKIGAAGLDVYEEESEYFFEDFSNEALADDTLARLLTFPNALITSHQAFLTREALKSIGETTFQSIKAFFAGEKLENEICYRCENDSCAKKANGTCF